MIVNTLRQTYIYAVVHVLTHHKYIEPYPNHKSTKVEAWKVVHRREGGHKRYQLHQRNNDSTNPVLHPVPHVEHCLREDVRSSVPSTCDCCQNVAQPNSHKLFVVVELLWVVLLDGSNVHGGAECDDEEEGDHCRNLGGDESTVYEDIWEGVRMRGEAMWIGVNDAS